MKKIELRVAVNAIIPRNDEVLLTRRSASIREPGKWCLPGGHVEVGERWVESMRREVREEIGLTVLESSLLGVYSDPKITVTEEPIILNGQELFIHFVVAVFIVTKVLGEPLANEEVDGWGWYTRDNLPSPIIRSHPIRLLDYWDGHRGVIR